MKKILVFVLFLLIFSFPAEGAKIYGKIYDLELNLVKDVLVVVNSTPEQRLLAKEGVYQFNLPLGNYLIKAKKGDLFTEELIKLESEGEYVYDLFLFPEIEEENIEIEDALFEEKPFFNLSLFILILGGILIIAALLFLFAKRRKKEPEEIIDDLAEEILNFINQEKRLSQKDLRKRFPLISESKISLVLTELESKGKIKKIKKGRGNIILRKDFKTN